MGGIVTARSIGTDGSVSPIVRQSFGVAKSSWTIPGKNPTRRAALDGDPDTYWHTIRGSYARLPPYEFTVDLARQQPIAGITVVQRTDNMGSPKMSDYNVQVSADGKERGNPVLAGLHG